MSDDEQIVRWVEAFRETQRQMSQAHEVYQKALAESHQKYLVAVGHSQHRLLQVLEHYGVSATQLEGLVPEDGTREFTRTREVSALAESSEAALDRAIPTVFSVPQPGRPFSPLVPGARVGILADALGVASHVNDMLVRRGFHTHVWEGAEADADVDVLLVMSGLQIDSSAVQDPLRRALATVSRDPETSIVIVHDMGGRFGTDFLEPARSYQAAMLGFADVLRHDSVRLVKTIDLDVGFRNPEEAAEDLVRELLMGADDLRVGLPEGDRVLWSAIANPLSQEDFPATSGLLILTVSDRRWSPLVTALSAEFQGIVVQLGNEEFEGVERIHCDLNNITSLTRAIDIAREQGPITHWIHLPLCDTESNGVADLDDLWDRDITPFQVVLANTSADPLVLIGVAIGNSSHLGFVTASVMRALCVAENKRREGETRVVSVSADIKSGIPLMRLELLMGGSHPDVRYIE